MKASKRKRDRWRPLITVAFLFVASIVNGQDAPPEPVLGPPIFQFDTPDASLPGRDGYVELRGGLIAPEYGGLWLEGAGRAVAGECQFAASFQCKP